jgi:hypothetical protein
MPFSTPRRRAPLAVLAGLLPLAMIAGQAGPATAVGGPGEDPVHQITVTVTGAADPFYGDPLTFRVKASTTDVYAGVYQGTKTIVEPVPLDGFEATPFSIPTLDTYRAGTTYTLRVDATGENSEGSKSFSFTPRHIPSQVKVSGGTRLTVPFSAPIYGVLEPTTPTTVKPSGGTMVFGRNGARMGTYPIRTDGTFALPTSMLVGLHQNLQVYYEGDAAYAPTLSGSGMAVVDVEVVKMPTTTTSALSAVKINQGDPVSVLASTAPTLADTTADAKGVMEVHAAQAGSSEFTKITETPYPGGRQQVSQSLQEWASTHPGFWTIRTVNHGTDIAAGSASDTSLQVVPPGNPVEDTSTQLALDAETATVLGAPVTATATVGSADGAVGSGSVAFSLDGTVVDTVPVSAAGTATTSVAAAVVGAQSITAAYLGTTEYAASASAARALTGLKAATTATATAPPGPVSAGTSIPVRVTANGSSVIPSGAATVSAAGTALGTVPLVAGAGSFRLPALPAGTHTLTVAYPGDASTTGSTASVVVTVAADTPPLVPTPKASSKTSLKVKKLAGRKARVTVRVAASGPAGSAVTGGVEVRRGKKVLRRGSLAESADGVVRLVVRKLPKGASKLTVRYLGSSTVLGSTSRAVKLRIR